MKCSSAWAIAALLVLGCAAIVHGDQKCGPMYMDPTTFGGKDAGVSPVSSVCTTTMVKATGSWNDVAYAKGWRALKDMEWIGATGSGQQIGIGVSTNREEDGGMWANPNAVSIYLDAKKTLYADPSVPTSGGLNTGFSDRLEPAGIYSRGDGMWLAVNYETNELWYAHPGMKPISFGLPDSFKGKELYPFYQAWNSKTLEILFDKPLLSYSCSSSMVFNLDSFGGYNPRNLPASQFVNINSLRTVGYRWNDVNYAKLSGVLMDGQWIGGRPPYSSAQVGIGVSTTPHADGGLRFNDNSLGIYLDAKSLHWGSPEVKDDPYNVGFSSRLVSDPNGSPNMRIMVDYTAGVLWYAHPYKKPIDFPLPESFIGKPLFPHYQVWNGKSITVTGVESSAAVPLES